MGPVGLPPGLCTLYNLLQAKSDVPQRCTPTYLATRQILSLTGQRADGCAGNQDFPPWVKAAREAGAWSTLCPQEGSGPFLSIRLWIGISKGGSAGGGGVGSGSFCCHYLGPLTF